MILGKRELGDGRAIVLCLMLYDNVRLCIGPDDASYYDDGWCYQAAQRAEAHAALAEWDGEGDPPPGWYKHLGSRRIRPEGDPAKEYVDTPMSRYKRGVL